MKSLNLITIVVTLMIIAACSASKKSVQVVVPPAPVVAEPAPVPFVKPANGIYAPGDEELAAVRTRDSSATLSQLKEGYIIYTQGACIGCHEAQNIYRYTETQWKVIVDNMALKAMMPLPHKEAVYKYVLAIKAAQPKEETR